MKCNPPQTTCPTSITASFVIREADGCTLLAKYYVCASHLSGAIRYVDQQGYDSYVAVVK